MPNWCYNTLEISGDEKVISKITNWNKSKSDKTDTGLFGLFFPMPKELENTTAPSPEPNKALIEKYGADNWYEWRYNNWGCKWDANEVCIEAETKKIMCLTFDTAWSPPIGFYQKLTRDYPRLNIRASFYESGNDFCGTWDSNLGEQCFSISDITQKCLLTYKNTYKDNVDEFEFRKRLEDIYQTDFSISGDVDVYEIFPDYYFEENLEDAEFCKEYNIKTQKESQ